MGTLICPIAIAGTGKSTLARKWVEGGLITHDAIVSLDQLRLQLTGDIANQSANKRLIDVARIIVDERLQRGLDVYMDSTHLTEEARRWSAERAELSGANLVWIRFHVPTQVSLARNAARELTVPDNVMRSQINNYMNIDWGSLPGVTLQASP